MKGAMTMGLLSKRPPLTVQLAGKAGWPVVSHCGDLCCVQSFDPGMVRMLWIRHQEGSHFIYFNVDFPIRFPLERTPQGLFARLLLRSVPLRRSHWRMDIDYACEALPYLYAVWPVSTVTPAFFHAVCQEMVDELRAFHQELRDKYAYTAPGGMAAPPAPPQPPATRQAHGQGMRYVGE